jgi:hypothetical protein
MGLSQWGLIGAAVGLAVGYLNFRFIVGLVETRLRATDKSANEAERQAFEQKVVLFRRIMFVFEIGILAVVGYVVGSQLEWIMQ